MRSSYGRGIVAELRSEVITSEDYTDGYEVLGCRVTFVFRAQANETCANRTYKGLFTKPPIHWRMKPLEYVSPDLFNLFSRARPDGAFWIVISFYWLHVASGASERGLDLSL